MPPSSEFDRSASQEEKRIAARLHHKTEGKEISFQQRAHTLTISIPYRRENNEEGNAKRAQIFISPYLDAS